MSRSLVRPVLVAALLALLLICGRFAVAGAASLEDALTGALVPSVAPSLLGPITSAGRVGWECKPERSAASAGWHEAGLPRGSGSP
ncbi:MAG: hypothetical protein ABSD52_00550 [Candidatus Cybelea sp.]